MTNRITPGSAEPLGVTPIADGVNVAVFSAHASAIEFCLFDADGNAELARLPLAARSGDVFHAHIADIPLGTRYGLRAHGPYAPEQGHRFNPAKLLVDPYALALDRPFVLHPSQFGFRDGDAVARDRIDDIDSAAFVPKGIVLDDAVLQKESTAVHVPWADTIIYELHVRGFTKQHPDIAESVRGTFAALADPAAIGHLRSLGITSVELMPAAAWIDERHLPPLGLHNYWGYNPIAMMAPDPRLAPGGWAEVRRAADALHAAGIEVLLDVVFNHSGESDELGPTLSLRGLDNASYYRLTPNEPQRYINDTGCGNCLALDRPPAVRLALDSMRVWMQLGGIDGFRFDLATTLGRRENGFDPRAPLLAAIEQDPLLSQAKLIAEPWDVGPGGYQVGNFPADFGEWNDRFRDDIRRFWRGDANLRGALATRLAGSADLFVAKQHPSRSVNFISAHDGFTLADLVSYAGKHNQANGEDNRDGTDANFSWNHGVDGASDDAQIIAARLRDQRNLLATLLLARGTPMLAMGAELGTSQRGNNNAYAQDNATSWLDWSSADLELTQFVSKVIALRRAQPTLHEDFFLDGKPFDASGIRDVEWRSADRVLTDSNDWERTDDTTLIAVFSAPATTQRDDRAAIALHRGADDLRIRLPPPRDGRRWHRCIDTAANSEPEPIDGHENILLAARSVAVFIERASASEAQASRDVDDATLARLAAAAGIATQWWDVAGNHRAVSRQTQRSLLAAMGLRSETTAQTRENLQHIAAMRERRLLPMSQVMRENRPASLSVSVAAGQRPPRGGLSIIDQNGGIAAHIAAPAFASQTMRDCAGDRLLTARLALPALPIGRYRVSFDAAPDLACALTVAPQCCYHPAAFDATATENRRRLGLSVQAYSLRRTNDLGIGDFSAIGDFAVQAAQAGAATVGINPLHMLFPAERERASPYHPSDRCFLDPIYLDLDALRDLPGFADANLQLHDDTCDRLRQRETIDYSGVWTFKHENLQRIYRSMLRAVRNQAAHPTVREFAGFIHRGGPQLHQFATYQALAAAHAPQAWWDWPNRLGDAQSADVATFGAQHEDAVTYHKFLQWLCDRQLAAAALRARDAGLALGLYRDLAVGAAIDGAEGWANASMLAKNVSIGAPPDPLAPDGQVWNLPPPDPLAWHAQDCAPFRAAVAANMRHAGILRIDHVLGLARLFWVPDGGKAVDGAYVDYPLDDLLGHLALESERSQCAVIGEDLGTVPEGLREKLAENGVLRYQVMLLERDGRGFKSPATYSRNAVACACTHDLPPLAGWWQGADIRERESLALISGEECADQLSLRREEKRALVDAIARDGIVLPSSLLSENLDAALDAEAMAALHAWLARAPSALLFAQAEDLAGQIAGQNLPGTDRERPNWRRRLPMTAGELFSLESTARILRALQ